jgi:serine/threonine-protein kinase
MSEPTLVADRYRLLRELGRGGMGLVYVARDERLGRDVALKTLYAVEEGGARDRLWREARAAASLSHPNVCQLFDLVEEGGQLYLAMELLAGESLEARLAGGPLALDEALTIGEGILAALDALHARGIVHRDLKPSNVFLTAHGVKVLDFGLALPLDAGELRLTRPGTLVGTPRYMAPEQWGSQSVTASTDLFVCGALLFEMLAGRPAFDGDTIAGLCHAVVAQQPPALAGGARVEAVDRVLRRALAKAPEERWPSAAAMAAALRAARGASDATAGRVPAGTELDGARTERLQARAVTRLMVLPFRLLRPDAEIDFLSFGLADALTVALGGLPGLVVRSSLSAAGLHGGAPDLLAVAREAEVDALLYGTLLRGGDRVRLQTQLVQVPGGTVLASATAQASLADVFALQDELTQTVVAALALHLSPADDRRLRERAPASGRAYELYLRGNDVRATSTSTSQLLQARDLYEQAVEEDPAFAPAWARLGRVYRVMAKYGHDGGDDDGARCRRLAGEAFERALALDPQLPLAHNLYTYFQVEEPGGALPAMLRLLGQVASGARHPELYAGLVVACRFCGLLEASLAANREARRLDPRAHTSVQYTYLLLGDLVQAMAHDENDTPTVRMMSLAELGRTADALAGLRALESKGLEGGLGAYITAIRASIEGDRAAVLAASAVPLHPRFRDPEGIYINARWVARVGEGEAALSMLAVAARGYWPVSSWERDPAWSSLRDDARFVALLAGVRERQAEAQRAFAAAGGERLLGLRLAASAS